MSEPRVEVVVVRCAGERAGRAGVLGPVEPGRGP